MSSSYDLTVRLWNLESREQVKLLTGHQDQVGDRNKVKCRKKKQVTAKSKVKLNFHAAMMRS